MAGPSDKCTACASQNLEEEDGMIVCTDCGTVAVDSGVMRHDATQNTGMSDPSIAFMNIPRLKGHMKYEARKRSASQMGEIRNEARDQCFAIVDKLSQSLCMTRDMRLELKSYVTQALSPGAEYYHSSRGKMVALASVCAYITVVKNGHSVTISEICSIAECEKREFASFYYRYLSHYPQNHPGLQKLDQLIPCCLKGLSLHENEKLKVFRLTLELLQLLDQVMLIESKCPTLVIFAAAFIAWKSVDRNRSSTRFSQFRLLTGIPSDLNLKRVTKYVTELEDQLMSLSCSIPWISQSKLKRKSVPQYVHDILQFKKTVVYDHKSQAESLVKAENERPDVVPVVEEEVDGDREISDSEIDMYIRSSSEVSAMKRLRAACGDE